MAHENLKSELYKNAGKTFVAKMTHAVYSWSTMVPEKYYEYRIFEELTVRYDTGEQTRLGLDKTDHYRFDVVFFIKPGNRALNQKQCYTVGIELKNSAEDLKYDDKIQYYLGWTDYFMIGVPTKLLNDAKSKIAAITEAHHECKNMIGLMNVETGDIEIIPRKQLVLHDNKIAIQNQVIYNCIFNDVKTINFTLDEVIISPVELIDEYREIENSVSYKEETKQIIPQDTNLTSQNDLTQTQLENVETTSSPVQLTDDEIVKQKERAKQQRLANAVREAERLNRLANRGSTLPPSTSALYNQLKPNAKQIFWAIVDNGGHCRREHIAATTQMSLPTVDRSLPELTKVGLISHEGSRKTGMFVVIASTDKSAACDTCADKNTCQFRGASEGRCAKHK